MREEFFELALPCAPRYDMVSLVAVLHHLPLTSALHAARALLGPGGRLVIVGLAKETSTDLPWSLASVFLNAAIGVIRHPRPVRTIPESMTAPTAEPLESLEQIQEAALAMCPGMKMRRSLFWRYTAVWVAQTER